MDLFAHARYVRTGGIDKNRVGLPRKNVEYVFQFIRTSEGELLKFGTVAFSKSVDRALARQVSDLVVTKTDRELLASISLRRIWKLGLETVRVLKH